MRMMVAVPAEGMTLDCRVAPRFGRCPFLLLVNSKTGQIVGHREGNDTEDHGIRMARWICDRGGALVLTSSLGPRALEYLQARGVRIIAGVEGTVREALGRFVNQAGSASARTGDSGR